MSCLVEAFSETGLPFTPRPLSAKRTCPDRAGHCYGTTTATHGHGFLLGGGSCSLAAKGSLRNRLLLLKEGGLFFFEEVRLVEQDRLYGQGCLYHNRRRLCGQGRPRHDRWLYR